MDPTILAHPAPAVPISPNPPPVQPASVRAKRGRLFYLGVAGLVLGAGCCLLSVVALLVSASLNHKTAPAATVLPASLPAATSTMEAINIPSATPGLAEITALPATQVSVVNGGPYKDDFSNSDSGWKVFSTDVADESYNPLGFYEMGVKQTSTYSVSLAPAAFPEPVKDIVITVRAQPALGDTGEFGVVCRYQDIDNFYLAGISGNQFYIGKQVKGEWTYLTSPKWQTLPVSTPDQDGYLSIGLSCTDAFIVMEVNGIGAAHVTDNEFSAGQAGLCVWAGDTAGKGGYFARAAFDDFSASLP